MEARGIAAHGDRAAEATARRNRARTLRECGWCEEISGVDEVLVRRDRLNRGDGVERRPQQLRKLAVAKPARLQVDPPQTALDPAHALIEHPEAFRYGGTAMHGGLIPADDEVETAVEKPAPPGEIVEGTAVGLAKRRSGGGRTRPQKGQPPRRQVARAEGDPEG